MASGQITKVGGWKTLSTAICSVARDKPEKALQASQFCSEASGRTRADKQILRVYLRNSLGPEMFPQAYEKGNL